MATFKSVVTKLGQASIAAAIQSGKDINIIEMAVGDGGGKAVQPVATQTKLVKEVYRTKLNSLKLDAKNANWVVAEAIISASVGGFWMREMGLYADDGVLIAVCNMADTYKPTLAEGSGRTQTLRMVITVTDTSAVSLTIDDSLVMATEEFVNDKIAEHEKTRNHPDATLTAKGLVQLSSATNSTSEAVAATPKAVKAANDNANGRLPSGGTAVAASKLAAARKIAGNAFDGTKDIEIKAEDVGAWSAGTSEKNAKALMDEIATAFKIKPPMTAADSLNTLRGLEAYGHYGVPGIAAATKAKGYPIDGFVGAVLVMLGGNSTQQVAFASTGRQWTRYIAGAWNGIDGPWTGWVETYSEKNKPTASDVGALPSNGTAVAANKLATARKIAGVDFDGSNDIAIGAGNVGAVQQGGGVGMRNNNVVHIGWSDGNKILAQIDNTPFGALYCESNKPSSADVGAYPATGGQLNGSMNATGDVTSGNGRDIASGRDVIASRALYESGGNVRVYSPNNVPSASDVGALSTAGGDVEYINGARHFASKSGSWEGAGAYASQYDNGSAPFMVPFGYKAPKGFSQYHPIVKGILQTLDYGYAAAISFGGVTTGNTSFPIAVINVNTDGKTSVSWSFDPTDGSFYSPGDINTGKSVTAGTGVFSYGDIYSDRNIHNKGIIQAGSGVYDTPNVRVYSPNYRPLPNEIGAVAADTCSYAGFAAGNPQSPYMRNSSNNEVVALARYDWVNVRIDDVIRWATANFVADVKVGPRVVFWSSIAGWSDAWDNLIPPGAVNISSQTYNDNRVNRVVYAYVMKLINGNWYNVGGS